MTTTLQQPFTAAYSGLYGKYGIIHVCRGVKEFLPCDNEDEATEIADKANKSRPMFQKTFWDSCESQLKTLGRKDGD